MAKSVLDITIRLFKEGGADKETVTGLVNVKKAITDAAAVGGTLVAAGYAIKKAFDATVGTMVAYADQVRSVSQMTGLNAEESSKLIQISDDLKVSFEDLQKVIQKNGDVYDYSVNGLAAMSEEYLSLSDAQEKADFMQKRFGKSWGDFVEMMQQGGEKIREAGDAINEGLILDEAALQNAREYEKQIDNISDSWDAFKVSAGAAVLPDLVSFLQDANAEIEEENGQLIQAEKGWRMWLGPIGLAWNALDFFKNKNDEATNSINAASSARMAGLASLYATKTATESAAESIKTINENNKEFMSVLGQVQSAEQSYQSTANQLTQERVDLEAQKNQLLAQGYGEQSTQIQEVNAKLAENSAAAQANANEHDMANKRIILGLMERKLAQDGVLDDKEMMWLLEKGVAWGVYSQQVVDETQRMIDEANNWAATINGLPTSKTFTLTTLYQNYGESAAMVNTGGGARRAKGTSGWETVPPGYPNDSFPVWLTSGEEFAVIPNGGGGGGVGGGNGGGGVSVNVSVNTSMNFADKEQIEAQMMPVILKGIRSAQAQGVL